MDTLLFLIGLSVGLLPIPCLIYASAFTERRKLHVDVERQELYDKMRGHKPWKSKILRRK